MVDSAILADLDSGLAGAAGTAQGQAELEQVELLEDEARVGR